MTIRTPLLYFLMAIAISPIARSEIENRSNYRIGVIQSLTGIAAEHGQNVLHALELSASKLNSQGDIVVELVVEDDGTDSKRAISAYQKLLAANVDAIVGATWGFTTEPLIPLAARDKIVLFNTSTLLEALSLSKGEGYVFNNGASVVSEVEPFRKFINRKKDGFKRAAIVHTNSTWGNAQKVAIETIILKNGISIVDSIELVSQDNNDWGSLVLRLKAKSPDLTVLISNPNDTELFVRRIKEQKFFTTIFSSANTFDSFRKSKTKSFFEGVCYTYPAKRLSSEVEFVNQFRLMWKQEPLISADNSYDVIPIIVNALNASKISKISLAEALKQTKYDGLVGQYVYSKDQSFSNGSSSLVCIKEGHPLVEDSIE